MPNLDPSSVVLLTLAGSMLLLLTNAVRYDLVALFVVLVLTLTGTLDSRDAFAGFASEPVVLIASMYVFGRAFTRTGLSGAMGQRLLAGAETSVRSLVFRLTLVAGLLSSVLSNTGVVATLIPICSGLSKRRGLAPSLLMIPMAFGSLLGGLLTVIATSKNVAINGLLHQAGEPGFGLFDFSLYGLILLLIGALYFWSFGFRLLPDRAGQASLTERYEIPRFLTEFLVPSTSPWINRSLADMDWLQKHQVRVVGILRAGAESPLMAPGPYNRVRVGDTLILQGHPEDLAAIAGELPESEGRFKPGGSHLSADDVSLLEAIVPAGSSLAGQTLAQSRFTEESGLNVLGIAQHGELEPAQIRETRIKVGDCLLIQGHQGDLRRLGEDRALILLQETAQRSLGKEAWLTLSLLGLVLFLATVTHASLAVLALAGALGLIVSGVVRLDNAYDAIDGSVLVLVGGMLALGHAFEQHGLSTHTAEFFLNLGQTHSSPSLLLLLMLVGSVLGTQVLNAIPTAAIMTPIALHLAQAMGLDARPFVMAVVSGTSFAFLSPVAHQANAMVMGPGNYRGTDFIKVGLPLTILMIVAAYALIPLFWPLGLAL